LHLCGLVQSFDTPSDTTAMPHQHYLLDAVCLITSYVILAVDKTVYVHVQGKQFEAVLYEKLRGTDIIVGSPPHGLPTNIVLTGLLM